MHVPFSASSRSEILKQMAGKTLDLLVIGGGITGAGIAWDASLRGMDTGLLEMRDFAWGTSSRSTKLIHGGLRYLKQGEVRLVMEVGRERERLHRNAPHLVIPEPMLLPIYKGGTFGYWASSAGLYVYDLLAGVKKAERRTMMDRSQSLLREPLLRKNNLKGAGYYFEYRTDDARLTVEVLKTAHSHGAQIVNYARALEFIYRERQVAGVAAIDELSGNRYEIYARNVVNAAGPWVDHVRQKDHAITGKRLLLTKGVHLVVDYHKLPIQQAAYLDVPDGRMIFVIPRRGKTYIGTTDTVYEGEIEAPRTTKRDRDYLLHAVNSAFEGIELKPGDVESSWVGLRPLIHEAGKGPSEISRKDEIFVSDSGLITIAGGKLTGFRKMAEKVVDLAMRQSDAEERRLLRECATDRDVVSGGGRGAYSDFETHRRELYRNGIQSGIEPQAVNALLSLYGSNVTHIYDKYAGLIDGDAGVIRDRSEEDHAEAILIAEIWYCIEHEMTVQAVDFIVRRTGLLYFDRRRAEQILEPVIQAMGEMLGWTKEEKRRQRSQVQQEISAVTEFSDSN